MDNDTDQGNDSKLQLAMNLAFLPTGAIGVHDFILRRYTAALLHIFLIVLGLFLFMLRRYDSLVSLSVFGLLMQVPILISYLWAIIEGLQLKKKRDQMKQPMVFEAQSQEMVYEQPPKRNIRESKAWSVISLVLAMIPFIIWVSCFDKPFRKVESSDNALLLLVGFYYIGPGIPITIASIATGLMGLKTEYRKVAIVSFIVKGATIIVILLALLSAFVAHR